MNRLDRIDNYEAVVLGFEGILANTGQERRNASRQACEAAAEANTEYRLMGALQHCMQEMTDDDELAAVKIAKILSDVIIIDEDNPNDKLVRNILWWRSELYKQKGEAGFDERSGAGNFVESVSISLNGKVGIVTATPRDQVEAFLNRHELNPFIKKSNIRAGKESEPREPDGMSYEAMAEQLGVTVASKLLVIDCSDKNLLAAEATGATILSLQVGEPAAVLDEVRQRDPRFDWVSSSFADVHEELAIPPLQQLRREAASSHASRPFIN